MSEAEATAIAQAAAGAAEAYSVGFDPRVFAVVNLATIVGSIYGPRVLVYMARQEQQRQQRARQAQPPNSGAGYPLGNATVRN